MKEAARESKAGFLTSRGLQSEGGHQGFHRARGRDGTPLPGDGCGAAELEGPLGCSRAWDIAKNGAQSLAGRQTSKQQPGPRV